MTPEQIRQRLLEISNSLKAFTEVEEPTEEQLSEMETLNVEFSALDKKLDIAEATAKNLAKATASAGRSAPAGSSLPRVEVSASAREKMGGFKSAGEFLLAVKTFGQTGARDNRFNNVMYEKSGEDGGFLVPETMSDGIIKKLDAPDSLWSRVNATPVSGNNLSFNVDESQPWNGGVQAYWTAEGAPITESKIALKQVDLRLHKLAALVKVTDELLDDATALESYINKSAGEAIMHKLNEAVLVGNGAGKPEGILNSPFAVTVSKVVGQAADTIVAQNVIDMYSHLIPQARAGAMWLVNAGAESQLNGLKNDNGDFIYLQSGSSLNQAPFSSLLGLPVMPMMSVLPALGDVGDLVLVNFSYYYGIVKSGGLKSAMSTHLHFDRDITAFRWTFRVDGKVPFRTPITTQYGAFDMSAIVKLEAR